MAENRTVLIDGEEEAVDPSFARELEEEVRAHFDRCYQCMTCTLGCPTSEHMDYPPHRLIRMVQMGLKDAVLRSKTLCLCISCESCTARCPNGIHVDALIDALRIRARKEGVEPAIPLIRAFHRAFLKPVRSGGKVFELGLVIRLKLATFQFFKDAVVGAKMFFKGKLGLTPSRIEGRDEVRRIFEETIDKE